MRREEFADWLSRRSYKGAPLTPTANRNRVGWLKALERTLPLIGLPHSDLDAVHAGGAWNDLMARMAAIRSDWRSNEEAARSMAPEATDPTGQINNILASARLYGHFADGKDPNYDAEEEQVQVDTKEADLIRTYALNHFIIPARGRGEATVSIRAGDVSRALALGRNHANVCQALKGSKFQAMAAVAPPIVEGNGSTSATRLIYTLDPAAHSKAARPMNNTPSSTNLILYGPPGTGKTFATAQEAVKLCSPGVNLDDRAAVDSEYRRLVEARQVEFVTFHQSYSYEDFVEGLRPPVSSKDGDGDEDKSGFRLEVSPGVFHRIATRAAASKGSTGEHFDLTGRRVFKMSIGEARNRDEAYLFEEALENGYTLLGYGEIDWSDNRFADRREIIAAWSEAEPEATPPSALSGKVQFPYRFRNEVRDRDLLIVSKGNGLIRAIGEVAGPYQYAPRPEGDFAHRRPVRWLWSDRDGIPADEIVNKGLSQWSIYELSVDDLNLAALERLLTSQEPDGPPEPFVLIIDEINRANISKVFGELITLLEPDKRLTPDGGGLKVRLPYSKEAFGVPANLHVVGTMNTADRSIALLDTALRRRFEFRELMPDPDLPELKAAGARCGVDLGKLLRTLNDRIEYLFDREHQIGHAYFIKCVSRSDLDAVMRHKVIPLLAEYFYEDWSKVALVLGDADASKPGRFLDRTELKPPAGSDFEGGSTRWRWTVRSAFLADAYADFQ